MAKLKHNHLEKLVLAQSHLAMTIFPLAMSQLTYSLTFRLPTTVTVGLLCG